MRKLVVNIYSDGVVLDNVMFTVMQGDLLLVEDSVSGKISTVFTRTYQVEAGEGDVSVLLQDGQIQGLTFTASLS